MCLQKLYFALKSTLILIIGTGKNFFTVSIFDFTNFDFTNLILQTMGIPPSISIFSCWKKVAFHLLQALTDLGLKGSKIEKTDVVCV